ncbi:MAG: hypothetical protein ACP5OU_07630 [Methanothrix sp.]
MNKTTAIKLVLLFAAIMLVSASVGAAMPPSGGPGHHGHHLSGFSFGHYWQPVWHGWTGYWGHWSPWGYNWFWGPW